MSSATPRPGDDERLEVAVAEIARSARLRNRARVERLAVLLGSDGTAVDGGVRKEALRLSHAIAGSAGTFGDVDLADAARDLESALETAPVGGGARVALERLRATGGGAGSR